MGLIFGWMRQRSGSTTLPIVLHTLNNLLCHVPRHHPRRMVELTELLARRLISRFRAAS